MSAETIRFPRSMKRGPKVKNGPCAKVIPFESPDLRFAINLYEFMFAQGAENWERWKARHYDDDFVAQQAFAIVERRHGYQNG